MVYILYLCNLKLFYRRRFRVVCKEFFVFFFVDFVFGLFFIFFDIINNEIFNIFVYEYFVLSSSCVSLYFYCILREGFFYYRRISI